MGLDQIANRMNPGKGVEEQAGDRAKSLQGNLPLARLAIQHALLWRDWRALIKRANTYQEDNSVIAQIHREAADITDAMRRVEDRLNRAINKAEKREPKGK